MSAILRWLCKRDLEVAIALTPAAIWIVAWIAEQTMKGWA